MKITPASAVFFTSCLINGLVSAAAMSPDENLVFVEKNGLVAVEAVLFFLRSEIEVGSFHDSFRLTPGVEPDGIHHIWQEQVWGIYKILRHPSDTCREVA